MSEYTVQPGDTLSKIAQNLLNDAHRWREITCKNRVLQGDMIDPGDVLIIPSSTTSRTNTRTASNQASNHHSSSNNDIFLISRIEFHNALTWKSYPAKDGKYKNFIASLNHAGITTKREAAMYLATLLHESNWLTTTEEYPNPESQRLYGTYIGRGYIQLSSIENYRAASAYFRKDYVNNPYMVSEDPHAWNVSAWYWKDQVHELVSSGFEAVVTYGIRPAQPHMERRNEIYYHVCDSLGLSHN